MISDQDSPLPRLSVTSLSQYVRLESCDRFLRFRLRREEERSLLHRWELTIQPLTPLLQEAGAEFERDVATRLAAHGERVVDLADEGIESTLAALRTLDGPAILLQAKLQAPLGDYLCEGRADVIRLERDPAGRLHLLVADIKASRHERMEHRLQVALYAHLLQEMAAGERLSLASLAGTVLHIRADGTLPPLDPAAPSFDLAPFRQVIARLVTDPDSVARRVATIPFKAVPYHLGYKCDGCLYNAICMYDSAERLDLSLVPYLSSVEKRVLQENGIRSLPELAALMELPERGSGVRELRVAPGQEERVQRLHNEWPIGPALPLLVQRARRALRRFDPSVEAVPFLYGAGFGTLPSDEEHPDLVKIFFDAQHDYLQDRVYLIAAQISGPAGEQTVIRCTEGPPTRESEQELLLSWVEGVLEAIHGVAGGACAPIHLYCYNHYDQRVLLEALKRHLEEVAALPAFFDLMTQSPALTQPIISFLSSEIQERWNLGTVCTPLHDAARMHGFDWSDGSHDFFRLFRARLFDNRRHVIRRPDGSLQPAGEELLSGDPHSVPIESASRFNSQIPLEYIYAIWGCLPEKAEEERLLAPFRAVTREAFLAFAAHRVRALAYLEGRFTYKARWLPKPPLDLPALAAPPATDPPLSQSLEEFLFMEHHAALQAKLQLYSQPIKRRVQSGLALLLRHEARISDEVHRFAVEFELLGLDPVLVMNGLRLREGAWTVLNEAESPSPAAKIKHGRLAIVEALGPDWIELRLLGMTFRGSTFRYYHKNRLEPEPGTHYTLDEMADDLNADKILESLRNVEPNTLYHWLQSRPGARKIAAEEREQFERFAGQVDLLEGRRRLTARQREVVAGRSGEPLLLVQGPPGTGKSQTLGWAVLARMAVAAAQGRPCRVAVSCKTHNAIHIVLAAIASKLQRLTTISTPLTRALAGMAIYKIGGEGAEEQPAGIRPLNPYEAGGQQLEEILAAPLVVIGATPGGLYNLARYRATGGKRQVDWSQPSFDLLVIDEASQMSLPEGVLAGAFLQPGGQALVVGDHRQMPPIIAHQWKEEEKRSTISAQPHLSLFESLLARDFPRVALDESFRLHSTIADFLQENIYVHDGIRFFSRRRELLPAAPPVDPFVDFALDPRYPVVIVEHGEQRSRQYNEQEAALVGPLVDVCARRLQLDGAEGIGVVVPHRAQKALLRERFPLLAASNSVDTVERFQGGERDVIIVSATASDPDFVLAEAEFLLNLNRLNVALSRPRKKLIVVASRSVVELLTSDLEIWENALIWKRLYYQYASEVLWQGERANTVVSVRGREAGQPLVHP